MLSASKYGLRNTNARSNKMIVVRPIALSCFRQKALAKILFSTIILSIFLPSLAYSEPVRNTSWSGSPWSHGHRTSGMQSSTPFPGIEDAVSSSVQFKRFASDLGRDIGPSPWLMLSSKKYIDAPHARSLWGASLHGVFKYSINAEKFEYVDHFLLSGPPSISWNLFRTTGKEGERIIVPQPLGLQVDDHKQSPCYGDTPSLLVFQDGDTLSSGMNCVKKLELEENALKKLCGVSDSLALGRSGVGITAAGNGDVMIKLIFRSKWYKGWRKKQYVAVANNSFDRFLTCSYVDDSESTNQAASEPAGEGKTYFYYATADGIVKLLYDANKSSLTRLWKVTIPYRTRTGTTPTLVGYGKDKFLVTVDGKCAVTNPFTGSISCDEDDTSPSKLYAIRRDVVDEKVMSLELPDFIETVENSPSAHGYTVVLANYVGYSAPGATPWFLRNAVGQKPYIRKFLQNIAERRDKRKQRIKGRKGDHIPDLHQRGVVAVSWDTEAQKWELAWQNPDVQMNGITTISSSSNLVYSSGTDKSDSKHVYLYGLAFQDKGTIRGGELMFKKKLGPVDDTWDPGNNLIINDDQSMIYSSFAGLVRIFQKK